MSVLAGLSGLQILSLINTQVMDVSALAHIHGLEIVAFPAPGSEDGSGAPVAVEPKARRASG